MASMPRYPSLASGATPKPQLTFEEDKPPENVVIAGADRTNNQPDLRFIRNLVARRDLTSLLGAG